MQLKFHSLILVLIIAFTACKSSQTLTSDTPEEQSDEVVVTTDDGTPVDIDWEALKALEEQESEPEWASKKGKYNPEPTQYFDLLKTELDVRFNWEKQHLLGKANLTMKPYFYPQTEVVLDAKGFDIHKVAKVNLGGTANGDTTNLVFEYDSLKLTIKLGEELTRKDTFQIHINYTAKPNELASGGSRAITSDQGLYFINPTGEEEDKPQQIWTQGETEASSCWFPTFDAPNVKTLQEIYITVDTAFTTISNGKLVFERKNNDGTRTDYWKMDKPHAPYLFAMAIGKFAKVSEEWNGKAVDYYVEPEYEPYAKAIFGNTPEMLTFFSKKLDYPYPWEKYAQVAVRDFVSGAMENTTVTIFMEEVQVNNHYLIDDNWDGIIAHELSHHWFGDLVTCESWANLPLNESFATYSEYLWAEYKYGTDEADLIWKEEFDAYLFESETKQEPLIRYRYLDKEDMFDSHSYAKGSLILHTLRNLIGDEAFFASLSLYLKKHEYGTAEIHDLRIAFEEVTGQDWHWFFEQWFMKAGHPQIYVKEDYENGEVILQVLQQQDQKYTPIYRLPLAVDIWVNGEKTRHQIEVTEASQTFTFPTSQAPDLVLFDAQTLLSGVVDHLKSTEAFILQYRKAEKILAKIDALEQLKSGIDEAEILPIMIEALSHEFWAIRDLSADAFEAYEGDRKDEVAEILKKMAVNDTNSLVRATAVSTLSSFGNYPEIIAKAFQDSSYTVVAYALYAESEMKEKEALPKFEEYETHPDINITSTVADFYSYYSIPNKSEWFTQKIKTAKGQMLQLLLNYYGTYLIGQPVEEQEKGVGVLENLARNHKINGIRLSAFQALALLSNVEGISAKLKDIQSKETDEQLKNVYNLMGTN